MIGQYIFIIGHLEGLSNTSKAHPQRLAIIDSEAFRKQKIPPPFECTIPMSVDYASLSHPSLLGLEARLHAIWTQHIDKSTVAITSFEL